MRESFSGGVAHGESTPFSFGLRDRFALQEHAFRGLEVMDKITIAVLHGYCLGGGVQLAISCDIRISSTDCRIGLPAINEGSSPEWPPSGCRD